MIPLGVVIAAAVVAGALTANAGDLLPWLSGFCSGSAVGIALGGEGLVVEAAQGSG